MPKTWYAKGLEGFADGSIDWDSGSIRAALVRGYVPDSVSHKYVSDVTDAGGSIVASTVVSNRMVDGPVLDADDSVFQAVPAGDPCQHIVVYQDSGAAETSRLVFHDDGKITVTAAAPASASSPVVYVDPLPLGIDSGASLVFSGGSVLVIASVGAEGTRALAVASLSGSVALAETAMVVPSGTHLPIVPDGSDVTVRWNGGANRIGRL